MATHALEMIATEAGKPVSRSTLRAYCWTCLFFAGLTTLAFYVVVSDPGFEL